VKEVDKRRKRKNGSALRSMQSESPFITKW
jgi:hypothetical protein